MNHNEYLKANGWKEYPDQFRKYSRCWFKRFDTPTPCRCNSDKPGMQVCVAVSEHDNHQSYEIDVQGELPDGTWIKLHNWAMPKSIEAGVALIPRLLGAWEFMCSQSEVSEKN